MTEQGAMAINCRVGGSVENWEEYHSFFRHSLRDKTKKKPQQLLKHHHSMTKIDERNTK